MPNLQREEFCPKDIRWAGTMTIQVTVRLRCRNTTCVVGRKWSSSLQSATHLVKRIDRLVNVTAHLPLTARSLVRRSSFYCRRTLLSTCLMSPAWLLCSCRRLKSRQGIDPTLALSIYDCNPPSAWSSSLAAVLQPADWRSQYSAIQYNTSRKHGNCECIATWGRPSHASPFSLQIRRHANFEVAEPPLPYYSVFAADTLLYAVTLTFDLWP